MNQKQVFQLLRQVGDASFLSVVGFLTLTKQLNNQTVWLGLMSFGAFLLANIFQPARVNWVGNKIIAGLTIVLVGASLIGVIIVDWRGIVLLFLLAYVGYRLLEVQRKNQLAIEKVYLELYLSQLEQGSQQLRQFKHDYQNILLSIGEYLKEEDLSGLNTYYQQQLAPTLAEIKEADVSFSDLGNLEDAPVKSVLRHKLLVAQTLGLKVQLEIPEKIEKFPGETIALVRMVGILLDNATEASQETSEKWLQVACFFEGKTVKLVVANPFSTNLPPLHELKKSGFTTKNQHRGLGLSNLENLVAKYPGVLLETSMEKGIFTQILSLEDR